MDFHDFALNNIFKAGGAFKADLGQGNSGKKRYYFVLNFDPETNIVILLASSTTQFEEHKDCSGGNDVHISLSPSEYNGFTENCLICCDRIAPVDKSELITIINNVGYELCDPLPEDILNRIKEGVKKTEILEERYKDMILGQIDL